MTLRLSALRDTLSLGGYCYGQQLTSKNPFSGVRIASIYTCGHHTTSNKRATYGRNHRGALICYLPRSVSNPLAIGKLRIAQLASTCVKLISIRKNKRSKVDSHQARNWYIIMLFANSINEKDVQRFAPVRTSITHSTSEVRMSLFPCILPCFESAGYEQALNVRGLSS